MRFPQLVIFDMDGLIFDTERLFMRQRAAILEEYGYHHREEDYIRTLGTCGDTLREILHRIYGPEYPEEEISQKSRAAVNQYIKEHGLTVKPGIRKLLQYLAQKEIPCCVASSTQRPVVEEYLKSAGLAGYFRYIMGGDEVHRPKPDPEIFLKCCTHFCVEPQCALVLEDSENGIRAAWNAKIPVICIPDLATPDAETAGMTAGIVQTAGDVIALLES